MPYRRRLIITTILILGGAVAWFAFVTRVVERSTPPQAEYLPPSPVPDVSLIECHGQTVTSADLRGKIWVANLMFTSCGNTCPLLSTTMSKLDRALGPRDDVRLVSITITPEYDRPEVLREYAARYHASSKWLFLTGERPQIVKLANDGFLLSAGSPGTLTHSDQFVLVDREGKVRGFFDGTKEESVKQILEAIAQLK